MRHAVAAALDIAGCSGLFDIVNLGAAFGGFLQSLIGDRDQWRIVGYAAETPP